MAGHSIVVAEATGSIGSGVSSRNSEVIHAGMYYPHRLPARRIIASPAAGGSMPSARSHGVPHARPGKLIVATNEAERSKIEAIAQQGAINGVERAHAGSTGRMPGPWSRSFPCVGALWSPQTGIVDSHALMLALQGDLEDHGGMVAFETAVTRPAPS